MTVEIDINKKLFDHNGVSPSVSFTFRVLQNSDLKYYLVNNLSPIDPPDLMVEGVNYSLALNENGEGGVVTFLGTIPNSNYRGVLITEYAYTQPSDLPTEGNFSEEAVEAALDRNTLLSIQLLEQLSRTLRFPLSDTANTAELPHAGARANSLFAFDALGNVTTVVLTDLSQLAVSSYFSQLASASDAQTALLLLGVPYYPAEIGAASILRFYENSSNGSNYVDLSGPDSLASTPLVRLPSQGGTLALTSDITTQLVPYSFISGFIPSISNVGATTAAIIVSLGQATDSSNAALITNPATASWAVANGNALNGYQGGTTLPNSTTIHFFAIIDAAGANPGIFASASLAPTLPASHTGGKYRRVFSIKTTGAGALIPYTATETSGGGMLANLTTQVLDMNGNSTTTAALITLSSLPTGVKLMARLRAMSNTNSYNGCLVTSPDETDVAPTISAGGGYNGTAPGFDFASTSVAQGIMNMVKDVLTDVSARVRVRSTGTINVQMVTSAFEDYRR